MRFAAVHESSYGTWRRCRAVAASASGITGSADAPERPLRLACGDPERPYQEIPTGDITTAALKRVGAGRKELFYSYGTTYAQTLGDQD